MKYIFSFIFLCCFVDCAHTHQITPIVFDMSQSEDAKLYNQALVEMRDSLYQESLQHFTEVKTKYPYSRLAILSDVRMGDVHFRKNQYADAIDAYRVFLQYNPSHPESSYAAFQIAEAYRKQIPEDWWFLPPTSEKDQASTLKAMHAYQEVIEKFKNSKQAEMAQTHIAMCEERLIQHEMYVARYYFKRKEYQGTIFRCQYMLETYKNFEFIDDVLFLQAQAFIHLNKHQEAENALKKLITDYPKSQHYLDSIRILHTFAEHSHTPSSP